MQLSNAPYWAKYAVVDHVAAGFRSDAGAWYQYAFWASTLTTATAFHTAFQGTIYPTGN
jgi:hypothetical protein